MRKANKTHKRGDAFGGGDGWRGEAFEAQSICNLDERQKRGANYKTHSR